LRGQTLADLIETEAPLSLQRSVRIIIQIANSLGEAHRQGIIHRNLTSHNIILQEKAGEEDFVKVSDFGFAKLLASEIQTFSTYRNKSVSPRYLSPEQIKGVMLDQRTDIYSLGILFYEMLASHPPFHSNSPIELSEMHLTMQPKSLNSLERSLNIPASIDRVIMQCLAKGLNQRIQSVLDLRKALMKCEEISQIVIEIAGPEVNSEVQAAKNNDSAKSLNPTLEQKPDNLNELLDEMKQPPQKKLAIFGGLILMVCIIIIVLFLLFRT